MLQIKSQLMSSGSQPGQVHEQSHYLTFGIKHSQALSVKWNLVEQKTRQVSDRATTHSQQKVS